MQRVMTVEDLFNKGMQYTDIPLQEGYAKALVNLDITNSGDTLTPRGGLHSTSSIDGCFAHLASAPYYDSANAKDYIVHHTGTTLVEIDSGADATLCRYAMIGQVFAHSSSVSGYSLDLTRSFLLIEYNDTVYVAKNMPTDSLATPLARSIQAIHNVTVQRPYGMDAIWTSISGNTYMPIIKKGSPETRFLGRIHTYVVTTPTFKIEWYISPITPKEVQPTQAINYGYNMLKPDPYAFVNTSTATGALQLNGILPKNDSGTIIFTSRPGDYVNFHLNYQYPGTDVSSSKKYLVQWEIKDLNSDTAVTTVQQVRKSPVYTPGDSIYIRLAPSFKQFTLIVKVYYKDVVDAVQYTTDDDDTKKLAPLKTLTLASYYLTADNASTTQNVTPTKYDLITCSGMCAWQQRLVVWGVKGARSTLFISEPNTPEYVPYPNNSEILTDNIVSAVPYMGKLLVFTYNSLYVLTMDTTGLSYSTKCIQENLVMTDDDACTVRTVKNMVYFRSGNHYYMVVPNTSAGVGELQLAPVSNPIKPLLENFSTNLDRLIDSVYNLPYTLELLEAFNDTYTTTLVDYYNYLDGDKMRNVYKCKLYVVNNPNLQNPTGRTRTMYLDFILTYDTVQRAWSSYVYQSNKHRMVSYEYNVADATTFLGIVPDATGAAYGADFIKTHGSAAKDTYRLDSSEPVRLFPNYQLLDTGVRAHDNQHKKRYRELQFTVNNLTQSALHFYSAFIVDDDTRKDMYTYTVSHITNPNDPNYGLITVERQMTAPSDVAGITKFTGTDDGWVMDFSKFPTITVAKVHIKVSGKGYNARLKLLSKNEVRYEILTTNWVYRPMFGR